MRYFLFPCFLLAGLLIPGVTHAATTWTGASDNNFFEPTNWDNGVPSTSNVGTINSGTIDLTGSSFSAFSATVIQNGGDVTNTVANLPLNGSWDLLGGTFSSGSTGSFDLRNATFNVNGGNIVPDSGGWRLENAGSNLNVLSGVQDFGSGRINQNGGNLLVDQASMTVGSLWMGNFGTQTSLLTLQGGASLTLTDSSNALRETTSSNTSSIQFGAGTSSLMATSANSMADFQIDFATGADNSSITVNSGGLDEAAWMTKWTNGSLTYNGSNTGNFGDFFDVTGDTLTLSIVPEPGTALLVGLGLWGLVVTNRRRTKR